MNYIYELDGREFKISAGSREVADKRFYKAAEKEGLSADKYRLYQVKVNRFGSEWKSFEGEFCRNYTR